MTDFASAREAMVDCQIRTSDVTKYPVIDAFLRVPREEFLPDAMRPVAYAGDHIDLGDARVVFDPRVFAKLLDALDLGPRDLVLDIGCALGYSTAVIARMAEAVIGLEQSSGMATAAEERLSEHGADNAIIETGDLAAGAPQHGPFDAILIEGGIEVLPASIADQLKTGGRITAIFVSGASGTARLGRKTASGIVWRRIFDATAPVLPGYAAAKAFEF